MIVRLAGWTVVTIAPNELQFDERDFRGGETAAEIVNFSVGSDTEFDISQFSTDHAAITVALRSDLDSD